MQHSKGQPSCTESRRSKPPQTHASRATLDPPLLARNKQKKKRGRQRDERGLLYTELNSQLKVVVARCSWGIILLDTTEENKLHCTLSVLQLSGSTIHTIDAEQQNVLALYCTVLPSLHELDFRHYSTQY